MREDDNDSDGNTTSLDTLRKERDRLHAQLEACRHDLRQARIELAQAREIQESLTERLQATGSESDRRTVAGGGGSTITKTRGRGAARPVGMWRRMKMSASVRAILQDIQLLHDSEWFDADWYLTEYPDVANAGVDPAEHYLRSGAPEGRDPGPLFSTDTYLQDHPGLAEQGINPLVHFLRSEHGKGT